MPTKKKRYICAMCKRKLTEDQMTQVRVNHYYGRVWVCGPAIDLSCKRLTEYNKSVRSGSRMDTVGPKVSI